MLIHPIICYHFTTHPMSWRVVNLEPGKWKTWVRFLIVLNSRIPSLIIARSVGCIQDAPSSSLGQNFFIHAFFGKNGPNIRLGPPTSKCDENNITSCLVIVLVFQRSTMNYSFLLVKFRRRLFRGVPWCPTRNFTWSSRMTFRRKGQGRNLEVLYWWRHL